MQIHDLIQGTPEWHAYRAQHFNASDAPAMMGCSPYKTRAQLIREVATGIREESHDVHSQRRFAEGHRTEAMSRPHAEAILGEDLYPVVGSEGKFSASFDGLTLAEDVVFEHKTLNKDIRAAFADIETIAPARLDTGAGKCLPLQYRVQMEQQLLVSGAGRALFMASKWDGSTLIEQHWCWYLPDQVLRQQIIDGWERFEQDVAAYAPQAEAPTVVAGPVETLPAVSVRMDGSLTVASNLERFGVSLRAFVAKIPESPSTDQEFADTDAACKALKSAEDSLDSAESTALASISCVEEMRRLVADLKNIARTTRLAKEKLVDKRKTEIKENIIAKARAAWADHLFALDGEIAPLHLSLPAPPFAEAAKGKRTLATLQDAVDTELARAKIAADAKAREVRAKLTWYGEEAAGHLFLFADLQDLVGKPEDDFRRAVLGRIADHKAAEERRAKQEADAKLLAAEVLMQAAAPKPAATPALAEVERAPWPTPAVAPAVQPFYDTPPPWAADDPLRQLLDHIATAFAGKFPSQPKVSQEFWADLRTLAAAVEASRASA